jgi:hypothetical protein
MAWHKNLGFWGVVIEFVADRGEGIMGDISYFSQQAPSISGNG